MQLYSYASCAFQSYGFLVSNLISSLGLKFGLKYGNLLQVWLF
jgi:hypothetical protein